MFENILIVNKVACDAILNEGKIWEIRGYPTHKRGRIGLTSSGTRKVFGTVEIIDCIKLNKELFDNSIMEHHIDLTWQELVKHTPEPYAWVLDGDSVEVFDEPLPFKYPQGAVRWVKYIPDEN